MTAISNSSQNPRIFAIVPAAGIGTRMSSDIPKQYLTITNKPVLQITIEKLLTINAVEAVIVALHEADTWWEKLSIAQHEKVYGTAGGMDRSKSVENALMFCKQNLVAENDKNNWALVHDAARPCVAARNIEELIHYTYSNVAIEHPAMSINGAILAHPVADTVKRVSQHYRITGTEDRSELWLAHTPQFFPLNYLLEALRYCQQHNIHVTDEASAVEAFGGRVAVVKDSRENIKITVPEDLQWAEHILRYAETINPTIK